MAEQENNNGGTLRERVRSLRLEESNEPSSNRGWWIPWVLCGVLFFATGLLALEAFSPIDDEMIKKLAEERGLSTGKPVSQSSALDKLGLPGSTGGPATEIALESKGYIVPYSLVQVSPKISGTVMELNIKEGMQVPEGFLLAKLEAVEYQSDLDHAIQAKNAANARLEMLKKFRPREIVQAEAELNDAVAQEEQMALKFGRAEDLKKQGAIAKEEYESADSAIKSMTARVRRLRIAYEFMKGPGPRDAQIAAAEAERDQAHADWEKADWRRKNVEVRAPIKGIILSKKTEKGNIVNPSAFSNGLSASLCEMADLHDLEVDLSIAERDISKLFAGQDCRVRAEAFSNRIYPGEISRIMPMGDRSKSSVTVRVKVGFPAVDAKGKALPKDGQGEFLRPEMGAIVTFLNRKAPG